MNFRDWLEHTYPEYDADTILDILDAFDLHEQVREQWSASQDDSDRGDWEYRRQIETEYENSAREAAQEMDAIRRSGL